MKARACSRRGAALLEVMIALAILAIAGLSLVAAVNENLSSIVRVRERDHALARANAFMSTVSLWPSEDLDRRLGWRTQGEWRLRIDRPVPVLYEITLADSTGRHTLLKTILYRPDIGRTP